MLTGMFTIFINKLLMRGMQTKPFHSIKIDNTGVLDGYALPMFMEYSVSPLISNSFPIIFKFKHKNST